MTRNCHTWNPQRGVLSRPWLHSVVVCAFVGLILGADSAYASVELAADPTAAISTAPVNAGTSPSNDGAIIVALVQSHMSNMAVSPESTVSGGGMPVGLAAENVIHQLVVIWMPLPWTGAHAIHFPLFLWRPPRQLMC